jgi:hypothetical protein
VKNQGVAGVIWGAEADRGEALAGRATKHRVDVPLANIRQVSDILCCSLGNIFAQDRPKWEVKLVGGAVYGVKLDGSSDIKPCLFKAEAHTAGTGKQIHTDGPFCPLHGYQKTRFGKNKGSEC